VLASLASLTRLLQVLTEGGGSADRGEDGVRIVKPHRNFRLFLSMNAETGGEVSRAMRNRCIEVCLLSPSEEEGGEVGEVVRGGDMADVVRNAGVADAVVCEKMVAVHQQEVAKAKADGLGGVVTLKLLSEWAAIFADLRCRGWGVDEALREGWIACYAVACGADAEWASWAPAVSSADAVMVDSANLQRAFAQDAFEARFEADSRLLRYLDRTCGSYGTGLKLHVEGVGGGDPLLLHATDLDWIAGNVADSDVLSSAAANFVRATDFEELERRKERCSDSSSFSPELQACVRSMYDFVLQSSTYGSLKRAHAKCRAALAVSGALDPRDNEQALADITRRGGDSLAK
jgi:hypothetical protein